VAESILPNGNERLKIAVISSFESGEVVEALRFGIGGQIHEWQVKAAEKFGDKDANCPAIEILKGMDAEKTPFSEGEKFQCGRTITTSRRIPSGLKIKSVFAHEHWDFVRGWGRKCADSNTDLPPHPRPLGNQIGADSRVKFGEKRFVKNAAREFFGLNSGFEASDALAKQRG
jgi:hypothetical protein